MDTEWNIALAVGGFVTGLVLGVALQRSRLCLVAAVSNFWLMRDRRQVLGYLAAIGVALLGTWLLEAGGWAAIADSVYRRAAIDWAGALSGGLVFGVGSALAGGCAGRTLVRVGEGHVGALIALLGFAFAAMMTLYGVLSPARLWLSTQTAVTLPAADGGLGAAVGQPHWVGVAVLAGLALLVVASTARRSGSGRLILGGAVVGLTVVLGWWVTGWLGQDEFAPAPPMSVAVSGPLAQSALWLTSPAQPLVGFAIPLLAGILLGALMAAAFSGEFHWVAPAPDFALTYLVGGVLMGVGAITAGGCNIGNALTGVSTTSVEALLATLAIVAGISLGLVWLQRYKATGPA